MSKSSRSPTKQSSRSAAAKKASKRSAAASREKKPAASLKTRVEAAKVPKSSDPPRKGATAASRSSTSTRAATSSARAGKVTPASSAKPAVRTATAEAAGRAATKSAKAKAGKGAAATKAAASRSTAARGARKGASGAALGAAARAPAKGSRAKKGASAEPATRAKPRRAAAKPKGPRAGPRGGRAPASTPAEAGRGSAADKAAANARGRGASPATRGRSATVADKPVTPFRGKPGGKQLVIVESPAKAKTINKYLGAQFEVKASVGHIRDLPSKGRGKHEPVPGVDLEDGFRPRYEILAAKEKTVSDLRRAAKQASEIWFATDLDREGEAIAWHLAEVLGIEPSRAKRVVFNAITKAEIQRAFSKPRPIDEDKVNAQQARRILDRIVGYQASPLLWKKVARGLSAGRVQSVAVRLIVEREREIAAFVPDESWRVAVRLTPDVGERPGLTRSWSQLVAAVDDKGKGPTQKTLQAWMSEHGCIRAELVELAGERFALECKADQPRDLTEEAKKVVEAVGLREVKVRTEEDAGGRGPARFRRAVEGTLDVAVRYRVRAIEAKRTSSRPPPPFITSSLQISSSSVLGFGAQRTMRLAQELYEGVALTGEGQVALITYMRTDSTHVTGEAIAAAREYIGSRIGAVYLPERPNVFSSSNKDAQDAHEAIRPTDVGRDPESIRALLHGPRAEDLYKLYKLIWSRFVACQMPAAQWDQTAVVLERSDKATGAVLRATGRTLAFDGFYRVAGVPGNGDEQTLPTVAREQELAPFVIEPEQRFSSPPSRYSEASLVKTLEAEGIGRPSTYAAIIQVIQDRKYVEQRDKRFYSTDLGEVVTDKLMEAFPELMDLGYTRTMEAQLDAIEERKVDWSAMLGDFYGRFARSLKIADQEMTHAMAEVTLAPFACPTCGARSSYRFGKNGRFLSCTRYPECNYAAPIDRQGRPLLPELLDLVSPTDGSGLQLRNGRFGPFIASVNYPKSSFVMNLDRKGGIKLPSPPALSTSLPCPRCQSPLSLRRGKRGPWLGCSTFPKCRGRLAWSAVEEREQGILMRELEEHERAHPVPTLTRRDGTPVKDGTAVGELMLPGELASLSLHPDYVAGGGENGAPAQTTIAPRQPKSRTSGRTRAPA